MARSERTPSKAQAGAGEEMSELSNLSSVSFAGAQMVVILLILPQGLFGRDE